MGIWDKCPYCQRHLEEDGSCQNPDCVKGEDTVVELDITEISKPLKKIADCLDDFLVLYGIDIEIRHGKNLREILCEKEKEHQDKD